MKFKSEKGVTGIDLVVAITIILIAIGTITTIYVNINKTYRSTNRSSVAGKIATDIMTAIDVSYFFEIDKTVDAAGHDNPVEIEGGKDISDLIKVLGSGANNLKIPIGYNVKVSVDEALEPTIASKELLKKIDVEISYLVSGERFAVEFTKYKGRYGATVPERPSQDFTDTDDFDYTPIKYNKLTEVWETTFFGDSTWYEYREQYWPIMVRTPKGTAALVDGQVNIAQNAEVYIWVPQMIEEIGSYYLTATVQELAAGGVMKNNVYTYIRHEKDTIGDDTVLEDEQVSFIYDELDYTTVLNEAAIVVQKGWYKFEFSGTAVTAKRLYDNLNLDRAGALFTYKEGNVISTIEIDKDIFVYKNKDILLEGINNYPVIN